MIEISKEEFVNRYLDTFWSLKGEKEYPKWKKVASAAYLKVTGYNNILNYVLLDREAELGYALLSYDVLFKTCCVLEAMLGVH